MGPHDSSIGHKKGHSKRVAVFRVVIGFSGSGRTDSNRRHSAWKVLAPNPAFFLPNPTADYVPQFCQYRDGTTGDIWSARRWTYLNYSRVFLAKSTPFQLRKTRDERAPHFFGPVGGYEAFAHIVKPLSPYVADAPCLPLAWMLHRPDRPRAALMLASP
jgi:hypothetical protein